MPAGSAAADPERGGPMHARRDRVCAVMVTHAPPIARLRAALAAIEPQVARVVVIDNGSPNAAEVERIAAQAGVRMHRLCANHGIGWAQNLGARWAFCAGFDAILLLDQDSVAEPPMVEALQRGLEALRGDGMHGDRMHGDRGDRMHGDRGEPAAAVAPQPIDASSGKPFPLLELGRGAAPASNGVGARLVPVAFALASGMLIPRAAWRAVGPMRADLFIDHVDTEWCCRARARGLTLAVVPAARMAHRLGERARRLWLGRWRLLPAHAPERHYFVLRNALWLARQPHVGAAIRWRLLLRAFGVVGAALVFEPQRFDRLRLAWRALADGIRGRLGPLR
ncbi:MAG: glycosyltransferase family 2 protein [Burkholderiales bacterium]|nr:MAG: glycosyltransferase family 2 protein [Burkholderiales bacterium]